MHQWVNEGKVVDLGANSEAFGSPSLQPTCFAPGASTGNRRDFVFISPDLLPYVHSFEVCRDPIIPTHSLLKFGLNIHDCIPQKQVLAPSPGIHNAFITAVKAKHNMQDNDAIPPATYKVSWPLYTTS